MFKNKNILVTGGAGVIGKELVQLLKKAKANIRVVDIVEKPDSLNDIEYFRMDLSENPQMLFRFNPDYVFHLAADFERSEESVGFWSSNFKNNIVASNFLVNEISKKSSVKKVIFASSYLIYNKELYDGSSAKDVVKLNENSEINPRNLTGIAKLQTEADLTFIGKHNVHKFKTASARIFRVYGLGSRDVISRWVRDIIQGKEISVFDEDNKFDYIFSKDVAQGLIELCQNDAEGVYNLGTGKSHSITEVLRILRDKLGEFKIKHVDESIFKERSEADITKLIADTNWSPEHDLEQGISEVIKFERERND